MKVSSARFLCFSCNASKDPFWLIKKKTFNKKETEVGVFSFHYALKFYIKKEKTTRECSEEQLFLELDRKVQMETTQFLRNMRRKMIIAKLLR